ncbi:Fe-S oxidoreductase [Desulfosporosinus orientis DSM 765]|uniref:Fe-S oxidoreductase n=1 Tax=Desulfosporosinus orientis (strain ATCC 19365 / DSM 765 / NCIMB 8382 / VKM B-1628 / Singapore I) TaxID=768706 RepID=G7WAU5_DESOD|nr:(Fe-S)-binding protein [Desulfosporosinus orientis]AET67156.1 Fe-S oxidoreductase [Desulfosporosinus orientis DSM 765]
MKVSLFATCLANALFPDVDLTMARILEHLGHTVDVPEGQVCCGQIAFNSGYFDDAREVARTLIDSLEHSEVVVSPSGSCVAMIHDYYPILFENDPLYLKKSQELIGKSYEFTQFIVDVLKQPDLGAHYSAKATYHPSCHATRLLEVGDAPLTLLEHVKGLELLPLPEAHLCCGFGGTFSVKMPKISEAMVAEKAQHVLDSGADLLLGLDMGCLMNISGYLEKINKPVKTMHIIQLLGEGIKL